jgi:hypothetical protein
MKYLQTYESYNFDQLILEDKQISIYKSIQDKTISKLSLNLYFAATYTWGVTMLYPIVDALVKNSDVPDITPQQIVLLTLFSITQILNMANNDVKKIKVELEKDGILTLAEKVKSSLLSVHKLFSFVSRSFGKVIDSFIDMVAYVGLGVPFTTAIVEIISKEGLNLETLPQKAMVLGGAAGIYGIKSIVETIIDLIKNKMKK